MNKLIKFIENKKYFQPLLLNLLTQKEQGNAIYYCDYTSEKKFLIILCYGTSVWEITETSKKNFIFHEPESFFQWSDYKKKTNLLKYEGKVLSSQAFIITISESIRHLANQVNLSFYDTKDILTFLFNFDTDFFNNNSSAIVLNKEPNLWVD